MLRSRDWIAPEQIEAARKVPIEDLLHALGYETEKTGLCEIRLKIDRSVVISENLWNDFGKSLTGGSTIDFIMKYHAPGTKLQDAVRQIYRLCLTPLAPDYSDGQPQPVRKYAENGEVKKEGQMISEGVKSLFILPERGKDARRAIAYLVKTRHIDYAIVSEMLKQGRIYQTPTGNVVFVGRDAEGLPRSAHLRGTISGVKFVQDYESSSKEYTFTMPGKPEGMVFFFESPIDALSHATMTKEKGEDWTLDTRISLNGVSMLAIRRFLRDHSETETIVLALDNDKTGREANDRIVRELEGEFSEVKVVIATSENKDYNEDLTFLRESKSFHKSQERII